MLLLLGVVTDFLTNGVLKILWISIYATAYIGIAASIYNHALSNQYRPLAKKIALAFLFGTLVGHLTFTGWQEARLYSMNVVSVSPLALESPEFSDRLYVTSELLQKKLIDQPTLKTVPVTMQMIRNYGCISSFKISTIADVDVMSDSKSYWVWKHVSGMPESDSHFAGMKEENDRVFWCRIQWY